MSNPGIHRLVDSAWEGSFHLYQRDVVLDEEGREELK